jgi:hypothetical protein
MGTVYHMAESFGWTPAQSMKTYGWDDLITTDEEKSSGWHREDTIMTVPPPPDSYNPVKDVTDYLSAVFEPEEKVCYVVTAYPDDDGKWKPFGQNTARTAKQLIDGIMKQYPASDTLEWNFDNDNFDALNRSDLLISDFSGILFDFALAFDKPVIYADTSFDKGPYDAWWLDEEMWMFRVLPTIGRQLKEEDMERLKDVIDETLGDPKLKEGREQAREQAWANRGKSVEAMADYLIEARKRLMEAPEESQAAS